MKKYQITKTPNYLILTLKKFGQNGKKMEDRVKYPLQLDIKKYLKLNLEFAKAIMGNQSTYYNLFSFIKA